MFVSVCVCAHSLTFTNMPRSQGWRPCQAMAIININRRLEISRLCLTWNRLALSLDCTLENTCWRFSAHLPCPISPMSDHSFTFRPHTHIHASKHTRDCSRRTITDGSVNIRKDRADDFPTVMPPTRLSHIVIYDDTSVHRCACFVRPLPPFLIPSYGSHIISTGYQQLSFGFSSFCLVRHFHATISTRLRYCYLLLFFILQPSIETDKIHLSRSILSGDREFIRVYASVPLYASACEQLIQKCNRVLAWICRNRYV